MKLYFAFSVTPAGSDPGPGSSSYIFSLDFGIHRNGGGGDPKLLHGPDDEERIRPALPLSGLYGKEDHHAVSIDTR